LPNLIKTIEKFATKEKSHFWSLNKRWIDRLKSWFCL